MPIPVREIAAAVPRRAGAACADSFFSSAAAGGASAGARDGDVPEPRQISAPPLATSTSGQTIASENQMPRPRKVSSTESSSKPTPSATSTALRPVGSRRRAAGLSPAGITSHPRAYSTIPTPPAAVATTNASRTRAASTP